MTFSFSRLVGYLHIVSWRGFLQNKMFLTFMVHCFLLGTFFKSMIEIGVNPEVTWSENPIDPMDLNRWCPLFKIDAFLKTNGYNLFQQAKKEKNTWRKRLSKSGPFRRCRLRKMWTEAVEGFQVSHAFSAQSVEGISLIILGVRYPWNLFCRIAIVALQLFLL